MIDEKIQFIQRKIWESKLKVLEMGINAGMGHITSAYSCAEILATLYYKVMRHNPKKPKWSERDRFIMSKNHGSLMIYPILADLGYFSENELMSFMQDGTRLGGHSKLILEGVDFAGGSLGIGLGIGAGMAYAAKMDNKDWLTFVLIGDGECYEGSIWEAAMFAAHNQLDNLIVIIDRNKLCCTDFTENILRLEPLEDKWRAFDWDTKEIYGHDIEQLINCFDNIQNTKRKKPFVIIANTVKGNGIDFMSNVPLFHGVAPKGDDAIRALAQINGAKV
jgi:transketolase